MLRKYEAVFTAVPDNVGMPAIWLPPPKVHHHLFEDILEAAVGIAVMIAAPELIPALGAALAVSGAVETALIYTALGAASGIASQSVGIALGQQKEFNWKAIAEGAILTGISAGVLKPSNALLSRAGATQNYMASGTGFSGYAKTILTAEKVALLQSAARTAIFGERFDWRSLGAAAASAGIGRYAGSELGLQNNAPIDSNKAALAAGFTSGVNTLTTDVAHGVNPFSQQGAYDLSVQTLGNMVGSRAASAAVDHYHVDESKHVAEDRPIHASNASSHHFEEEANDHLSQLSLDPQKASRGLSEMNLQQREAAQQTSGRAARWNAERSSSRSESNLSTTMFDKSSAFLNAAANSKIISGINTVGDWVADTAVVKAINAVNPIVIGSELVTKAGQLYRQGDVLNAAGAVGLAALSFLPGEVFAWGGFRAGVGFFGSRLGMFGRAESTVNLAHNAADRLRLRTTLHLQEAGILDESGRLTQAAIRNTEPAIRPGSVLNNPSVVDELTKGGSQITDWTKYKTTSVELSSGQKIQVHFYQNQVTGEINYTHPDFKVKGVVNEFYTPRPLTENSRYISLIPQDILDSYRPKF